MNILSLFDGMSCGRIALDVLDIPVTNYYASEIDKYAQQVSDYCYPGEITRMGSITEWRKWYIDFSSIDLFMGGSPCQGFSMAGKMAGTGAMLDGEKIIVDSREKYLELKEKGAEFLSQSYLFWEYILLLDHIKILNPNVKFLLENVKMKKGFLDLITNAIGVEPILINSALVSAQNRNCYYWCDWYGEQPKDLGVVLADILEHTVDKSFYHTDAAINYMQQGNEKWQQAGSRRADRYTQSADKEKSFCLTANIHKGVPYNYLEVRVYDRKRGLGKKLEKSCTLSASDWRGLNRNQTQTAVVNSVDYSYRKLTPRECARLQTIPEYIIDKMLNSGVSNTQLYKMLGNGWTVDVIAHLISFMYIERITGL